MGTVRIRTVYVESPLSINLAVFQNIISHLPLGILGAQDTFLQQSSVAHKRSGCKHPVKLLFEQYQHISTGCLLGLNVSRVHWDRSGLSPLPAPRGDVELAPHRHCSEGQCPGLAPDAWSKNTNGACSPENIRLLHWYEHRFILALLVESDF